MPGPFQTLLTEDADDQQSLKLLAEVGFDDAPSAAARLRGLARSDAERTAFGGCLPMLMAMLRDAPVPDASLVNFERYVKSVPDRHETYLYLREHPRSVEILVRLFVGSQFLTEILIQNPHYLQELTLHSRIADFKSREQLLDEARSIIEASSDPPLDALRRFQRWELLRIGACDAFGLMDLRSITRQLSLLADAVVQTVLDEVARELNADLSGFAVVALGKLGGRELNYSSDIDLIFVSDGDASEYWQLGQKLIAAIHAPSPFGFLYRVDMRLRPWGQSGALVNTVDAHVNYLVKDAELWERQALIKSRVVAGSQSVGDLFIREVEPAIYTSAPEELREDVLLSKSRIEDEAKAGGTEWGDVKSGRGSIRDIEFTVQYLQLVNGGLVHELRSPNTLDALVRLAEFGFLHADEYRILSDAYVFLRTIEHSLQLVQSGQTHSLPRSRRKLGWLARRLDFLNAEQLRDHFDRCTAQVRRIFHKYVRDGGSAGQQSVAVASPIDAHRRKMGPSYTDVFTESQVADHAMKLERLSDESPVCVEIERPQADRWRITVIGRDHPGCLSILTGLMLAHEIDIIDGDVFTGIRTESTPGRARRFVDSFLVRYLGSGDAAATLKAYAIELPGLMRSVYDGYVDEVRSDLLRRVSRRVADVLPPAPGLAGVEIEIDNERHPDFTVLRIESSDTVGFLYELTNALTLCRVNIEQVQLTTRQGRVLDTLHITGEDGLPLTDERQLQQLRAAIVLIKHFTQLLPRSPDPRRALRQFREFLEDLFRREDWVEQLSSLKRTDVLDALAKLLGVSTFLWMDFLRLQHENLFPVVRDIDRLRHARTRSDLAADIAERLASADESEQRAVLNRFKDREMFRVDMRHILGHCSSFTRFAAELTDVADVTVQSAVSVCLRELTARYGEPHLDSGAACRMAVLALGKCGGRELGFASDIELMFVYEGTGRTSGSKQTSNATFFEKLAKRFCESIAARADGIFEIDLRLRPYGQAGPAAVAIDVFEDYFGPDGAAWPFERQALIKLRIVAGDTEFGERIVRTRDEIVYSGQCFDKSAMLAMREKQIRQLVTPGAVNAKLSAGGLVDWEYLVQALQMVHGDKLPQVRTTNTREAIDALHAAGVLADADHQTIRESHSFLRRVINCLRVVRGNARDLTIPTPDSTDFAFLARQLGYGRDAGQLQEKLSSTLAAAEPLVARLL